MIPRHAQLHQCWGERVTSSLRGGVAVVTGGAGTGAGLGRGLVTELAHRGLRVAILDIDLGAATKLAETISSDGGEAIACQVDVSDPATLVRAADAVRSAFGACNVLCAHAVTGINPLAQDLWAPEEWRATMNGVVVGTAATVHAFLPLMREADGVRRVVFTASSTALAPGLYQGPYRAGKVAVVSLAESLALEFGPEGIEVLIAFPHGMAASVPEDDTGSGADRAQKALHDALDGLDLPPAMLARFAAIGEEMAQDPTDLATGASVAVAIVDGIECGAKYVITHGRSFERAFRERQALLDAAFAELGDRGHRPVARA